jgi:hypothetical protein
MSTSGRCSRRRTWRCTEHPALATWTCWQPEESRNEAFPGLTQHRLAANDRSGWGMGVATADQANIQYGALLEEKATG